MMVLIYKEHKNSCYNIKMNSKKIELTDLLQSITTDKESGTSTSQVLLSQWLSLYPKKYDVLLLLLHYPLTTDARFDIYEALYDRAPMDVFEATFALLNEHDKEQFLAARHKHLSSDVQKINTYPLMLSIKEEMLKNVSLDKPLPWQNQTFHKDIQFLLKKAHKKEIIKHIELYSQEELIRMIGNLISIEIENEYGFEYPFNYKIMETIIRAYAKKYDDPLLLELPAIDSEYKSHSALAILAVRHQIEKANVQFSAGMVYDMMYAMEDENAGNYYANNSQKIGVLLRNEKARKYFQSLPILFSSEKCESDFEYYDNAQPQIYYSLMALGCHQLTQEQLHDLTEKIQNCYIPFDKEQLYGPLMPLLFHAFNVHPEDYPAIAIQFELSTGKSGENFNVKTLTAIDWGHINQWAYDRYANTVSQNITEEYVLHLT